MLNISELKKWLVNKKEEYEEIAYKSMSGSRTVNYMAKSTTMKEVLKHIEEIIKNDKTSK